jgi:formylglycine-generating enzyme required for sulfatase activity
VGGAGSLSKSYYGTYDQTGNVMEWLDTPDFSLPQYRWLAGGSWRDTDPQAINSSFYPEAPGTRENADTGFRVGAMIGVPEPSSLALAVVAVGCLAIACRRRR